ncbi:hypothetical protein HFD88_001681 [Aspergillus terreus]|nr:hypothetical protein HFD88_001681 [Aspergillus terreus]
MSNEDLTITWAFLRAMVAREQHLVNQVSKLETSLFNAGVDNHHERVAFNDLSARYHELFASYKKLLADYGRMKDASSAVCAHCIGKSTSRPFKNTSRGNDTALETE